MKKSGLCLHATPAASAKDVVATLKAKGIDTNESLVYSVKKTWKQARRRPRKQPSKPLLLPRSPPLPHPMGVWVLEPRLQLPRLLLKRSEAGLP